MNLGKTSRSRLVIYTNCKTKMNFEMHHRNRGQTTDTADKDIKKNMVYVLTMCKLEKKIMSAMYCC